jgi:Leucine-rich repeat (LRR) protein
VFDSLSNSIVQLKLFCAFESLTSLEELILDHNRLKRLNENTFKPLKRLLRLDLDNNELEEIDSGAFENLTSLEKLYLFNNKLKSIGANTFKAIEKLESLELHRNELISSIR